MISRQRSLRAIARAQERMDTLAPDTATGPAADVASRGSATDPADHLPPPSAPPHPSVATLTG